MSDFYEIKLTIESDLSAMFTFALQLNKESQEDVLTNFIKQYISDSFSKVSKVVSPKSTSKVYYELEQVDFDSDNAKALRRIPLWAQKPQQFNHRIIKAYFQIQGESDRVTVDALSNRCSDPIKYPATYTPGFYGNFASMKTDAGNSHGKVFEVEHDIVSIWPKISSTLNEYKSSFIGSEENRAFNILFADLLKKATSVDVHIRFSIKSLFGSEWDAISTKSRLMIGREFFRYINKGYVNGIRVLPEKDDDNCQMYEKI